MLKIAGYSDTIKKKREDLKNMEFQIKKPEYVNKTFRIPKTLADNLSAVAQKENVSVNELVVQCCNFALSNIKSE